MKAHHRWILVAASSLSLVGCYSPDGEPNRTADGALIGGAVGAGTGALIGGGRHAVGGALIGGAVGALTGGLIGQSMDQAQRERLRAAAPVTYQRVVEGRPLDLNDVKELTRAGVGDDLIISDIRSSHAVFHLSTADIVSLKQAGVSERVIDELMRTPNTVVATTAPPPPPQEEVMYPAPGPGYLWVGGSWAWVNGGWVWSRGYWSPRPHGYHTWVGGAWAPAHGHYVWRHGHWR